MDTNTLVAIFTVSVPIVQFFFYRSIAYGTEKGKNRAVKELEAEKYIMNLCQSIDNRFITLIAECLNEEAKNDSICAPEEEEDNHLLQKVVQLERFLTTYKIRYLSISKVKRLTGLTYSISEQYLSGDLLQLDRGDPGYNKIEYKQKKELIGLLEEILGMFLPKLKMEESTVTKESKMIQMLINNPTIIIIIISLTLITSVIGWFI